MRPMDFGLRINWIHRRRFTLVELLVIIAIIMILGMLLLPQMQKSLNTSYTATCANQFRQIAVGSHSYAQDQNGFLPHDYPTQFWMTGLKPYLGEAFSCTTSYWLSHKGAPNFAYCPAYDKTMPTSWPAPQISRAGYNTVNTCQANYVLNSRMNPDGTRYNMQMRLNAVPKPSLCILFAESNSYESVHAWYGGSNYAVYYNPRHNYHVTGVRVDGASFQQPYVYDYATRGIHTQFLGSVLAVDRYSWDSWGYEILYPGKK